MIQLTIDEKLLLSEARSNGLNIFLIEIQISNKLGRDEYREHPLLKLIDEIGIIVVTTPKYNNICHDGLEKMVSLKIIFVTDKNEDYFNDPLIQSLVPFEEELFSGKKDYKILIIEDNPIASLLESTLMNPYGVCHTVSNGEEGLNLFKESLIQNNPYDIIILDLVMPGIKGSDVLKNIRKLEESNSIKGLERSKVIITTSTDETSTLMDLFRAETDAYIIKPLTREKIEKQLANLKLI